MPISEGKANVIGYFIIFFGGTLPLCNGRFGELFKKEFWTNEYLFAITSFEMNRVVQDAIFAEISRGIS